MSLEERVARVVDVIRLSEDGVFVVEAPTEGLSKVYLDRIRAALPEKPISLEFTERDSYIPYSIVSKINEVFRAYVSHSSRFFDALEDGKILLVYGAHVVGRRDGFLRVDLFEGDIIISEVPGEGHVKPAPPDGELLLAIISALRDKKGLVLNGFDYIIHAAGPEKALEFAEMLISVLRKEGKGAAIVVSKWAAEEYPCIGNLESLADMVVSSPHRPTMGIRVYEEPAPVDVAVTSLPLEIARGRYGAVKYIHVGAEGYTPEEMDFAIYEELKSCIAEGHTSIVIDCVDEFVRRGGVSSTYLFLKALADAVLPHGGTVYVVEFDDMEAFSSILQYEYPHEATGKPNEKSALKYLRALVSYFPILVMENVHRADPDTLRTLSLLAQAGVGGKVLLSLSSQELETTHVVKHALLEDIRQNSIYFPLPVLTLDEFAEVLDLPPEKAKRLYEETGGDPTLALVKEDRYIISPLERMGEKIMRMSPKARGVVIASWLLGGSVPHELVKALTDEDDYVIEELSSSVFLTFEDDSVKLSGALAERAIALYTSPHERGLVAIRLLERLTDPQEKLLAVERAGLRSRVLELWRDAVNRLMETGGVYTAAERLATLIEKGLYDGEMAYEGARLMLAAGRVNEAMKYLAIAESEGYDMGKIIALKVRILTETGRFYSAYVYAEMYRDALKSMGADDLIPTTLVKMGHVKKALGYISKMRDGINKFRLVGYIFAMQGDGKLAVEAFERAKNVAGGRGSNYTEYANLLIAKAALQPDQVLQALMNEISWARRREENRIAVALLNALGIIYRIKGDLEKSMEFYQEALHCIKGERVPELRGTILLNYAETLYHRQNIETAKNVVMTALRELSSVDVFPSVIQANLLLWEITGDEKYMENASNLARDFEGECCERYMDLYIALSSGDGKIAEIIEEFAPLKRALSCTCEELKKNAPGLMINYLPPAMALKGCEKMEKKNITPLLLRFIFLL